MGCKVNTNANKPSSKYPKSPSRINQEHINRRNADKTQSTFLLSSQNKITIEQYREGIIGRNILYQGPFGKVITLYCDDTASGRPHEIVETYFQSLLPVYANTHSDNSFYAVIMNKISRDAKDYLLDAFNAPDNYYVLGTGTGSTGAIYHFQEILMQKYPKIITGTRVKDLKQKAPICFLTEYEHHSNIISWLRWGFDIKPIENTGINDWEKGLKDLNKKILENLDNPLIVISTSAASNVTSQLTPLKKISQLIMKIKQEHPTAAHKIIWCVDLAAFASHGTIDINDLRLDAVFISPHKLTGGTCSSGLLIFNSDHYDLTADPTRPAGGTVNAVTGYTKEETIFSEEIDERENPGTPGIMQLIRASLAFQLQYKIGIEYIEKREHELKCRVFESIQKMNKEWKAASSKTEITILGIQDPNQRLSVFSIQIHAGIEGKLIHYSLIHRLLNDIFGIQLRSGCNCAGPFGVQLLNFNEEDVKGFITEIFENGNKYLKPGWVRFNVHFSFTDEDFEYLMFGLKFVAENCEAITEKYYFGNIQGQYRFKPELSLLRQNSLGSLAKSLFIDINHPLKVEQIDEALRNGLQKERMNFAKEILNFKSGTS